MLAAPLSKVLRTTKKHLDILKTLNLNTVGDLLSYYPRGYTDSSEFTKIIDMKLDEVNTVLGSIKSIFTIRTRNGKHLTKAIFSDETGSIEVVWFNQQFLQRVLPRNSEIILSGKLKLTGGKLIFQAPAYELVNKYKEQVHTGRIVPVYHETEGISSKWLREKIKPLVDEWAYLFEEYMPAEIIKAEKLIDLQTAIKNIHFPENYEILKKARERLSFDELFLLQLKVLQKKKLWQKISKKEEKKMATQKEHLIDFVNKLPFELTNAQK